MQISKIVITGGPCAGKSSATSRIGREFAKLGYTVLFVPETATELITGGVAPWTCGTVKEYQKCQLELQLKKESIFEEAAGTMPNDKILIVCDRGALDNKAYMTLDDFYWMVNELGKNEVELRDSYDAVFHLVTAAKSGGKFYTTENNSARTETVEEACALDDRLISAWTGHPHFRVIENCDDFEQKMNRLIEEIASFLKAPAIETVEHRYLIEYPDTEWLESIPNCERIEIIQTYLKSDGITETRLRQRGSKGNYVYFKNVKKIGSEKSETETRISKDEYLELLMEADTSKRQIRKNRYCLTYGTQYFEIDVYPFWKDKALMKIELNPSNSVQIPDEIKVINEVSNDPSYKNAYLATVGINNDL